MPEWETFAAGERRALLDSFLGLVSHARRPAPSAEKPDRVEPFLTVQVQVWVREFRRLVRQVRPPEAPPAFAWADERGRGRGDRDGHWLPLAHCRECGAESAPARPLTAADLEHFLRGALRRLRIRGGIHHPLLAGYVRSAGNWFLLTKRKQPPLEMLAGQVLPPGCFLDAPEMLKRQLVAHAMDAWARQETTLRSLPPRAGFILAQGREAAFPGRFVAYHQAHREELFASFLDRFGRYLSDAPARSLDRRRPGRPRGGLLPDRRPDRRRAGESPRRQAHPRAPAAGRAGLPLPELDFQLQTSSGRSGPESDLAWPGRKVAVLAASQVADRGAFEAAGWHVLLHPVDPAELVRAMGGSPAEE